MCEECPGEVMIDERGQHVCEDCGLEHQLPSNDAEHNSSSSMGDARQSEAGPLGTVFGSMADVSPELKAKFRKWGQKQQSWNREKDPMYLQVKAALVEMFGKDTASAVDLMTRASTQQLTSEDAEHRMGLSKGDAKKLKLPKTSISRLGGEQHPEKRGGGKQAKLHIMALAIASVSADWLGTPPIDEKDLMKRYNITKKQLRLAKKSIRQNFQHRIKEEIIDKDVVKKRNAADRREDEYQIALENLMNVVDEFFDEPLRSEITHEFFEAFIQIEGESIDSEHANVPIGLLAACVLCQVLKDRGLLNGKQSKIAESVGKTGSGLGSRLKLLEKKDPYGVFNASAPVQAMLFRSSASEAGGGDMVGQLTQHRPSRRSLYKNPKRFNSPSPPTKQSSKQPEGNRGGEDEDSR